MSHSSIAQNMLTIPSTPEDSHRRNSCYSTKSQRHSSTIKTFSSKTTDVSRKNKKNININTESRKKNNKDVITLQRDHNNSSILQCEHEETDKMPGMEGND